MTDFFALLDQPRVPLLDPAALREVFHRKTLEQHPDKSPGGEDEFASLNEAYQVLQDPKRRLHHLLALEGYVPPATQAASPELQEIFLGLGEFKQRADRFVKKAEQTSNGLSRSLLKVEALAVEQELTAWREKIAALLESAMKELNAIDAAWLSDRARQIPALSNLYLRFAYLGRWSAQLDEIAFQLSS